MRLTPALAASVAVLAFAAASSAAAEEGMWTFDNFPIARANQTLGDQYRPGVAGPGQAVVGQVRRLFGGPRLR